MTADVESPSSAVTPPTEGACGPIPKRRQLFLLFGLISLTWAGFLIYMMQGLHLTDRVSYMDNLDYQGADIDSIFGVETANACYKRCEDHDSCLAYTYVKSEHVCWLKGEGWTAKSNPNTISGAINATLASIRRSSTNFSYMANGNQDWDKDWDEGESSYRESDEWDGDKWRNKWDDDEGRNDEGAYGGGGSVRVSDEDIGRYEDNTDFFGDVKVFTEVHSVAECANYCASEGACAAWSLDKGHFLCLLRLLNVSTVRYSSEFISARLSAPELAARVAERAAEANRSSLDEDDTPYRLATLRPPFAGPPWPLPAALTAPGVLENVDLRGGDVRHVAGIESVADCRAACAGATDFTCAGFTLSKANGFCLLKNSSYTRKPQNRSKGVISALMGS